MMVNNVRIGIGVLYEHHGYVDFVHAQANGDSLNAVIRGIDPGMYILIIDLFNDGRSCRRNESATELNEKLLTWIAPLFLPAPIFSFFGEGGVGGGADTVRCHWKLTDLTQGC